jgi:hypothetical protein
MLHPSGFVPGGLVVFASAIVGLLCAPPALGASDSRYECQAFDPEFHDELDIFVYQHIDKDTGPPVVLTQQGVAQYIDSANNGDLISGTDGVFVEDLATYPDSQAGPKFSNGEESGVAERFIAYTREVSGDLAVGIRKYNELATDCDTNAASCFPSNLDGQVPDTGDIDFTDRAFVYTTEEETLDYRAQALYNYQDLANSEDNGVRWAVLDEWLPSGSEGEEAFEDDTVVWGRLQELRTGPNANDRLLKGVTVHSAGGPGNQVFLIDAADPGSVSEIQVTTGAGIKFAPYLFFNSDPNNSYDTNMVVFRQAASQLPVQSDIVIWYQPTLGGSWSHFLTITAEDLGEDGERDFLLSPEAFTYDGKTWILFSSSNTLEVASQTDGNIWVARVDTGALQAIRLNSRAAPPNDVRPRYEGEVYFPDGDPPVFFYSKEAILDADSDCPFETGLGAKILNTEVRRVVLTSGAELP